MNYTIGKTARGYWTFFEVTPDGYKQLGFLSYYSATDAAEALTKYLREKGI